MGRISPPSDSHSSTFTKIKRAASTASLLSLTKSDSPPPSRNISPKLKAQFILFVTHHGYSMKNAAKTLGLSYSTCKKIFSKFRKTNKAQRAFRSQKGSVTAGYRELKSGQTVGLQVIALVAGGESAA